MEFHKFDFIFKEDFLLHDFQFCVQQSWQQHYNQKDYSGKWTSISLRSISGMETDIFAHPNSLFKNTPTLEKCDYFKQIISQFECEKESIRLLNLAPNSLIKEHKDQSAGYEDGFFRLHIPIMTNENVVFTVNKKVLPMKVGECWYANFNLPHFVSNEGKTDRIHLVIDCKRNDWSDKLFKSIGYDFESENKPNYDNETKLKMIEQLSFMKTEAAENLILQLKKELQIL